MLNIFGKIVSVLISIFSFGIFIFVHELGHFMAAKKAGVKVLEFAIGMGPQILCFKRAETEYSLRLFPFGGFVSMEGENEKSQDSRSFSVQPIWKRTIILIAGAAMNLILGFLLSLIITVAKDYVSTTIIAEFNENAVTNQWLQVDDKILKINNKKIKTTDDIVFNLAMIRDGKAVIEVLRDDEKLTFDVNFETVYLEDEKMNIPTLDFYVYSTKKTFKNVMHQSFFGAISVVKAVWFSLLGLFSGVFSMNSLSGPIGTIEVISSTFNIKNMIPFFQVLMMMTINVGVFNLLPFPALDGGRVVFLLIEKILGRPVPQKYEAIVNTVGLFLLFGLMIFTAFSDIRKLIGL